MTLHEAIEQFLARYDAKTTRAAYSEALERYFKASGVKTVDMAKAVTRDDFPRILRELEKTYKPATVAQTMSAVRQFYGALHAEDRSVEDPTLGHKHKTIDNVPDWNVLHEGAPAEMLEKITDPRDRAIFSALVLQGWRASELCNMKWGNLRQLNTGKWVCEWKGKRNRLRTQGMQESVLEAIRAIGGKVAAGAPLIPKKDGSPFTRHDLRNIVKRYAVATGHRVTPHGLRATYISSVISRKGIEAARQLAGHEKISTTQRYSRWQVTSDDDLTVDDL